MKPDFLRLSLIVAVLSLMATPVRATHLRAGEITVERDNCNNLRFTITVTVFTNTLGTSVLFGGEDDILDFGDGSDPDGDGRPGIKVPETENTLRPELGDGIATASFTITHTYAAASPYVISYSEPNRNEGVINMDNSVNTRFYIETRIVIDPFYGCNVNTPQLAVPPIDQGCTGVAWFHNPGAYDLDGDSLSYELVVPFRERNTPVVNYREPDDAGFYTSPIGNEDQNGPPAFRINEIDGTITWDAPGRSGEYNIAFVIKEWRNVQGRWFQIGFVRRDMQIIVKDCDNERPDLIVPEDVCVEAGTLLKATIYGTDPDSSDVKIEAFSEIFEFAPEQSPATFIPGGVYQSSYPTPAEVDFEWQTNCGHVKDIPYQVVFKITDKASVGPNLVTFKTWRIRVVGPAPQWDDTSPAVTAPGNSSVNLNWDPYFCENAKEMQVWRRVDSLQFVPDSCQTGMPPNLGYSLIATVPIATSAYVDNNLAAGAVYCYRLVALFPAPKRGESYMSEEVCIPAVLADAPIITNVTIDKTSVDDGQVTVKWVAPFEADPVAYPPPYTYNIFRAEGEIPGAFVEVGSSNSLDFVDDGLNTEQRIYRYQVQAVSQGNNAILDSSAVAGTVRLEARPTVDQIELMWRADVPWSNEVQGLRHIVYRGNEGATTAAELIKIDSVDVNVVGFNYIDTGAFNSEPLEPGRVYCYVIETLGSYGSDHPNVAPLQPFHNFSQMLCTELGDSIPPCQPVIIPTIVLGEGCAKVDSLGQIRADEGLCEPDIGYEFENVVSWGVPAIECASDIAYYNIYFASEIGGVYQRIATNVEDTSYVHTGLTSYKGCYKVEAVDRSGNVSPLSEQICFDNCPSYDLPNVFSPNYDPCNQLFAASRGAPDTGETGSGPCGYNSGIQCARFVNDVDFTVFNRWGKEVYTYASRLGEEKDIFIDWNGKANDGTDLAAGVYYYVAKVEFDVVDPSKRKQTLKGWIKLLR